MKRRASHPSPKATENIPAPIPVSPRTVEHALKVNGRHVTPGTEVSIKGFPGTWRFRFVEMVTTLAGARWVTVYGGKKAGGLKKEANEWSEAAFRSFDPERISKVHTTPARRR